MIARQELFDIAVALTLAVLLAVTGYSLWRARRMKGDPSIEALLARLSAIDRSKLSSIAAAYDGSLQEDGADQVLEKWQMWDLIGGMEGFEAMVANCTVLIDLACHVQQWYPEALPVAEQLRLNAREIQWHLERLRGAERRGNLEIVFPDYAQRAVAVYYGMTRHVVALYEASETPGLSAVQTAL